MSSSVVAAAASSLSAAASAALSLSAPAVVAAPESLAGVVPFLDVYSENPECYLAHEGTSMV